MSLISDPIAARIKAAADADSAARATIARDGAAARRRRRSRFVKLPPRANGLAWTDSWGIEVAVAQSRAQSEDEELVIGEK